MSKEFSSRGKEYWAGKMDQIASDTTRLSHASVTRVLKGAFTRRHPHIIPAPDAPLFVSVHRHLPEEYEGPEAEDKTVVQMTFPLPGTEHLFTWDVKLEGDRLIRYGLDDIPLTSNQITLIDSIAQRREPEEEYIDADTIDTYRSFQEPTE